MYIIIYNNDECKAACCRCLVSSKWHIFGQWYNKLAYDLQTVDILVFGWQYTGRYWQLSNVEPTQDCNAPEASQLSYDSL